MDGFVRYTAEGSREIDSSNVVMFVYAIIHRPVMVPVCISTSRTWLANIVET